MKILYLVVIFHFLEHVAQMFELYFLHWSRPDCLGLLGLWQPWLMRSEWLHYGFALYMLLALCYFIDRANNKVWWMRAIYLQHYHHLEHVLLLAQALSGVAMVNRISIGGLFFPRLELHFFYNLMVLIPMSLGIQSKNY